MVVYQYYTLKMRKRKGENLQISSTMVFFPLYFIMDSGYTNEVSVYKLYLLGVNLSVIGRVLGQAFLRTTSPSRLRHATSPGRGGFGSPRKVNGFARGSPTRGAVERSETERLYEGKPDREPLQRRFTQVSGNTAALRGASYLIKWQFCVVTSFKMSLAQGDKVTPADKVSHLLSPPHFIKLIK